MKTQTIARLCVLLLATAIGLLFAHACRGQDLPTTDELRRVDSLYIVALETENVALYKKIVVDSAACQQEKAGFRTALTSANLDRTYLQTRNNQLARDNETIKAGYDERGSQVTTLTARVAELERKHEPRTWFGRTRKKVTTGLTITGGVTAVYVIVRIVKLFVPL